MPGLVACHQQDRRPPRVEYEQDPDLGAPGRRRPKLLHVGDPRRRDRIDQRATLGRAAAFQNQDGLVHQLVAGRVGLMQPVEEGLDFGGQQDLPLHTARLRAYRTRNVI